MVEFWHYFAITLPIALAVWALIEWRQRRKRAPSPRREPTFDEPTFDEPTASEPACAPRAECVHPHFKRVYILRDGVNVPTEEMQCVQCRQRMRA